MKKILFVSFRKTYSVFSLSRHAILEVTSSIQTHTILGFLARQTRKNFLIEGLEIFYIWPDELVDFVKIEEKVDEYQPDIIAVSLLHVDFGAYSMFRHMVERILSKNVIWIAGGYLPTSDPISSIIEGKFNYIIQSHGEMPFYLLLQYLVNAQGNIKDIPNLIWIENGKIQINSTKIFPDEEKKTKLLYEPFNVENYVKESWQIPTINDMRYLTTWYTRGCPYNCGFCLNKAMNLSKYIIRDPDLVIDEIFEMNDNYGINYVFFADENFLLNVVAARKLLERMIKRGFKSRARFTFMTNVNSISENEPELLDLLREAGCEEIQFGVESGSELMLKKMNKKNSIEQCYKAFQLTSEKGIMTTSMMVLGYEGETMETLEETKNFLRKLKPDRVSYFFVVAFPNTYLYSQYESEAQSLPLFFYDTDFPVFKVKSLEEDLMANNIKPDYYLDLGVMRILKKYDFSFSDSQLYLLSFREKMMYEYYISNEFFEKQKEVFVRRSKIYKEDRNLLLKGARQWFNILEKSVGFKGYADTLINILNNGALS